MSETFNARVLRSISDDYEELSTIVMEVDAEASLVLGALFSLINDGLAASYRYDHLTIDFVEVPFDGAKKDDLYFYATKDGRRHVAESNRQ